MPSRVFFDLSTWHLIQWLYLPRALAQAQALRVNYSDTRLHERLMRVLHQRDGHRIAHEVEQAKIRCSEFGAASTLDFDAVEVALQATLTPNDLHDHRQALL